MKIMEKIGENVAKYPKRIIVLTIIVSIILGYFASLAEVETNWHNFMPDNKEVNAYFEVAEKYGESEPVQILVEGDGDVLKKEILIEVLNAENEMINDEKVSNQLKTPEMPSMSITSVADFIAQGEFAKNLQILMQSGNNIEFPKIPQNINQTIEGNLTLQIIQNLVGQAMPSLIDNLTQYIQIAIMPQLTLVTQERMMQIIMSLSIEQKISIIEGGNVSIFMSDANITIPKLNEIAVPIPEGNISIQNDTENIIAKNPNGTVTILPNGNISIDFEDKNITLENGTKINLTKIEIESQQIKEILSGCIKIPKIDAKLEFNGMDDKKIKENIHWLVTNESVPQEQKNMVLLLLSKDFDRNKALPKAKSMIVMVMFNATRMEGESDKDLMDRLKKVESRILDIINSKEEKSEMRVMGMALMDDEIQKIADQNMKVLLPIAFTLVVIILLITYRTISDTFLGIIGLFLAIIWMYGLGVIFGLMFTELNTAAPILVIGLGIDYGIHVILRYREEKRHGFKIDKAILLTVGSVGVALLLATLTTVIGFASNATSPVPVLVHFGIFCVFGILSSFIIMVTFVPAMRQLLDKRNEKKNKNADEKINKIDKNEKKVVKASGINFLNKGLGFGAYSAEHHPIPVLFIVFLITIASIYGALQLETEFSQDDFLPDNSELAETMKYIDKNFNGTMMTVCVVLVKGENIASKDGINAINRSVENMINDKRVIVINNVPQVESIIGLINKYANEKIVLGNSSFPAYPDFVEIYKNSVGKNGLLEKNITELYDWLYLNDPNAKFLLHKNENGNYDGSVIRIYIDTKTLGEQGEAYDELKDDVFPLKNLTNQGVLDDVVVTGAPILIYTISNSLQKSQLRSIAITIIVSLIVLTICYLWIRKSRILGFLTTLPVVLVLTWMFGTMYLFGLKLNAMTTLIGSLTIGLGITYAIHVTQRFIEDLKRIDDIDEACKYTVQHTGTALFGAAATTIAGFGILVASTMPPMRQFGGITALVILYSFLASVFLLPTFLVIWAKWNKRKDYIKKMQENKSL